MKFFIIPLAALMLCLAGCASSKTEVLKCDSFNRTADVKVQLSGNEIVFSRGKEKQIVSAFHKLNDVRFFSAVKAPVILAATQESGFPGWTLIVCRFSNKEKGPFSVYPEVVDPMQEKGKKYIVSKVTGIAPDGKSVFLTIDSRKAVFHLDTKKVVF